MEDLCHGRIQMEETEMSTEAAYSMQPEFAKLDGERLFPEHLKRARKHTKKVKAESHGQYEALLEDRAKYPKPTHDYKDQPRWEGLEAEWLLKQDVAAGLNEMVTQKQFFQSWKEYHEDFDIDFIRQHIKQEERL